MQEFTGAQWLLIDAASQFGLDKEFFEVRLEFGRELLPLIESAPDDAEELAMFLDDYISEADEPEMFAASCLAIKDVLCGRPIGYTLGLDAASSGPQLLSVLTRCEEGMMNTGVIDSGKVPNLYSFVAEQMGVSVDRKRVKKATVPHVYGSRKAPLEVFGDLYDTFVKAYASVVPWAEWAKNTLINCWNPNADYHEWDTPDGGVAHVKVIIQEESKGYFQGRQYTYKYKVIGTKAKGEAGARSLGANVTHSYDGYVLRELHARCNYNKRKVLSVIQRIKKYLVGELDVHHGRNIEKKRDALRLQRLAKRFNNFSVRVIEFIDSYTIQGMNKDYLREILSRLEWMLKYPPFDVRTIHDEFGCNPNNVNRMKKVYNILLGEAYASTWLFDVIADLSGRSYHEYLPEYDETVRELIEENTYALG